MSGIKRMISIKVIKVIKTRHHDNADSPLRLTRPFALPIPFSTNPALATGQSLKTTRDVTSASGIYTLQLSGMRYKAGGHTGP